MKDKKNILDSYFEAAKNEKVNISLGDISSVVGQSIAGHAVAQVATVVKQSLFNLKYVLISGTALTSVVVPLVIFTANTEVSEKEKVENISLAVEETRISEDYPIMEAVIISDLKGDEKEEIICCNYRELSSKKKNKTVKTKSDALTAENNSDQVVLSENPDKPDPLYMHAKNNTLLQSEITDDLKLNNTEDVDSLIKKKKSLDLNVEPYFRFTYIQKDFVTIKNSSNKTVYNEVSNLVYNNGRWAKTRIKNKYGFVNSKGIEVVKTKYSKIYPFNRRDNNWAKVLLKNKYGYIDNAGREIVKPRYDKIYLFSNNIEGWAMVKKDKKLGFINDKGKEIVPTIYDKIFRFGDYKENWAKVKKNGHYGFIDTNGKVVVPVVYSDIGYFGEVMEGYMRVKKRNKVIFIDSKGEKL